MWQTSDWHQCCQCLWLIYLYHYHNESFLPLHLTVQFLFEKSLKIAVTQKKTASSPSNSTRAPARHLSPQNEASARGIFHGNQNKSFFAFKKMACANLGSIISCHCASPPGSYHIGAHHRERASCQKAKNDSCMHATLFCLLLIGVTSRGLLETGFVLIASRASEGW